MEKGIKREVEHNFEEIFNKIKDIYDFEMSEIDISKSEESIKIVIENQELYDDWLEYIETAPLPQIDKIEQVNHNDGIYLKVDYILKTDFAKLTRKIRIKSNGKVSIYNVITFEDMKEGIKLNVNVEYDTYGNIIFLIEKL